ncbi:MAG: sulfotransferase domain-containing protein [Rhizobiales bacterium]|nr:sulfotransferase domain-containing protein [Hyphomicrobiales bacterium]
MYKVIWVAGMPRSGSMWTFNVVRALARGAGYRVLPEEVFVTELEAFDYAHREIAANRDPGAVLVLKVHARLDAIPPGNFVITNLRDIRDSAFSYMRFMHVDFETALAKGRTQTAIVDHYLRFPERQRMVLRYEALTSAPADAVARIAERIGVRIHDHAAQAIATTFSRASVKALIEQMSSAVRGAAGSGHPTGGHNLLRRGDGVITVMDRSTGFQSGHVSDYRDGDWRRHLSREQILAMDEAFGDWLARHGYAA